MREASVYSWKRPPSAFEAATAGPAAGIRSGSLRAAKNSDPETDVPSTMKSGMLSLEKVV